MGCNHIYGLAYGVDESWLVHEDMLERDKDYMERWFAFCPICGEELDVD